jgi:endonuclease/exonuclease/phosphatase family metal-dependent hydrolase
MLQRCAGLHEAFVHALGRTPRAFPARWPTLALDRVCGRHVSAERPRVLSSRPWSHLSERALRAAQIAL